MSLSPSSTSDLAIARLPTRSHPLYQTDVSIEHLAHIKDWLDEMIMLAPLYPLEERVMYLTRDEIKLMEQTSFERNHINQIIFNWSTIPNDSIWAESLNSSTKFDNCYSYWRISFATPQPDVPISIIFIERCQSFNSSNVRFDETTDSFIAITTREELEVLFNNLSRTGNTPIKGDMDDFISQMASAKVFAL